MKRKEIIKKIGTLLVVSLMVASLSACGSKKMTEAENKKTTATKSVINTTKRPESTKNNSTNNTTTAIKETIPATEKNTETESITKVVETIPNITTETSSQYSESTPAEIETQAPTYTPSAPESEPTPEPETEYNQEINIPEGAYPAGTVFTSNDGIIKQEYIECKYDGYSNEDYLNCYYYIYGVQYAGYFINGVQCLKTPNTMFKVKWNNGELYAYNKATSDYTDKVLTSDDEIREAFIKGFNQEKLKNAQTEEGRTPIDDVIDFNMCADATAHCYYMDEIGLMKHSDMKWLDKYHDYDSTNGGGGKEGISGRGTIITYKTAMQEGEELCTHIDAQFYKFYKIGFGYKYGYNYLGEPVVWWCIGGTYNK